MKLLTYLRSNQFAITIAILSVIVQSFHSFTAFYNTSALKGPWGISQAVLFALVIDLAILFYTVRGRRDIAMYAAVAMVTINGYYYYQHLGLTFEFIFGCFLSLIIPVSVYFYSEEIKEDDGDGMLNAYAGKIEHLKGERQNLIERNVVLADELGLVRKELNDQQDHSRYYLGELNKWERGEHKLEPNDKSLVNVKDEFEPDQIEEEEITTGKTIKISRTGGDRNDKQ
jgi:hypothetical protein